MSYSKEFIEFVATISGEAGGCSNTTWKVVAHCIKNRLGFAEWVEAESIQAYLEKDFDALTDQTAPVRKVISEMNSGKLSKHTKEIIDAIYPIYNDLEEDFTNGVVLYFSPKAQAQFHKENPNKYKAIPDFINSKTEVVSIKGTENDDMQWYKLKGSSRFYIQFIDITAIPLVGSKISISYKKTKNVPTLSNLITNNKGEIRSILVADGWGARFTANGAPVKNDKGKELMLIADGKNHSAVVVVNNGKGGIKSKTDVHNQQPTVSQPQKDRTPENSSQEEPKSNSSKNSSEKKDVIFSIKIIDSDNKPIPNMAYFLKYKNNDKKHTVGADGVERNIIAENGQTLSLEINGKDTRQVIKSFTASSGVAEQVIKFELHHFEILFRHAETKKAISHLNLVQTYRGKQYDKQTNSEGKILVNAMSGFELNYKLRDGRNLLTIKVDKNKDLRIIDVDSNAIEQATKNIKSGTQSIEPEKVSNNPGSAAKQEVESKDQTSKRNKTTSTTSNGHPKTVVNDSASEVEFTIITLNQQTNRMQSGLNYFISYKGKQRSHTSGTHGEGKKIHRGEKDREIEIFLENQQSQKISVGKYKLVSGIQDITIKCISVDLGGVKIIFSEGVSSALQAEVSAKTRQTLARLGKLAGKSSIVITSARRTARRQAELMYKSKIRYSANGRAIIAISNRNIPKEQALKLMEEKILEFQNKNMVVSNHCLSPAAYARKNVVDLGKNSNNAASAQALNHFHKICKQAVAEGWITKVITPIDDNAEGAFHIEINQ